MKTYVVLMDWIHDRAMRSNPRPWDRTQERARKSTSRGARRSNPKRVRRLNLRPVDEIEPRKSQESMSKGSEEIEYETQRRDRTQYRLKRSNSRKNEEIKTKRERAHEGDGAREKMLTSESWQLPSPLSLSYLANEENIKKLFVYLEHRAQALFISFFER